jgi:hypothetical protein
MNEVDLEGLVVAVENRLAEAMATIAAGAFVDLSDLPQRIAMVCSRAVAERRTVMADRLAALILRLDELERALRAQIDGLGREDRTDPRQAAQSYGAAQLRRDDEE